MSSKPPIHVALQLQLAGLDSYQIHSVDYTGGISEPFLVNIELTTSEGLMFFDQVLFTPMTLTILGDTTPAYCAGILYNATLLYSLQDGRGYYRLELRPSLSLLESVVRSGVFNDLSIVELTQGILLDHDGLASPVLSSKDQLRFALSKPDEAYPRLAQWLQANESMLAFWQRCLTQQGLSFAFDHRSEQCPLVISDQLERVFTPFPVPASGFDLDELSLAPRLSRVLVTKSSKGPQRIRVTGYNPDFPGQTIDAVSLVNPKSNSQAEYLWRFDALSQEEAETWSEWVAEYHRGQQHASRAEARGMLFAGERMAIADHPLADDSLITKSHLRLLVDAHRSNQLRQSVAEFVFHVERDSAPYRELPVFHRENGILVGAKVLSLTGSPTGDDHALDGKGNYTVALPDSWHTVGRGYINGVRAVQPIHTQDHQLNMPMPVGSEVTLAFHADSLLRPFIAGATTHSSKPSLTQNTNPQDSVLQDKRGNRLAFVNQGEFDREQKTGRKAATVLETPNYNPQGQSSYVRSGDPVDSDLSYPSVYGSSGLFAYTEGDLHAQHDGGQVTLIGNRGDGDLNSPGQPVYRHLVQADLKDGGMHVMESSTVDHHQQRIVVKDAHITTTHDAESITTKHVAKQTVEQVNANTTTTHYVNREDHYQSGMVSSGFNQYQHTLKTPLHQTTQSGTLRQDDHFGLRTTHMLHADNTHDANSMTQSIDEGQYQINTHQQVSNSLNEQIGSLNRNEGQTVYQARNYQDIAHQYAHTGQMSIMSDATPSVKGPQLKVGSRGRPKPQIPAEIVISLVDTQGADVSTSALAPIMQELKVRYHGTQMGQDPFPETKADFSTGKLTIKAFLSQITQIELQLLPGSLSRQQSVSIVAINGKSLPMVSDSVTLDLTDLDYKTQSTAGTYTRHYKIALMLLPPALMFNFRQDFAKLSGQLSGEDLTTYQTLLPYFQNPIPYTEPNNPILQPWMLNYFKAQGNNVTLFIHGYNVHYGQFTTDKTTRAQSGTGAHHWLLDMELNLNQAAGFKPAAQRKNYAQYTRIIGIGWMGDPASSTDYMAATPMTLFPAKKAAALIKQLKAEGLTINIIAHSLGNEVLLNTLELCAEQGTTVDHVFMWEPAVPNDALNPEPRQYFPMALNGQTLNYGYNYPTALKAAEKVTILYSDDDSILANLPARNTDLSDIKVIWDTYEDPAGGGAMAGIAAGTSLINSDLPGQLKGKVISIYHLANLYVYPFSFFFNASDADLEAYYTGWRAHYKTYLNPNGQPILLSPSLSQQQFQIRNRYPRLFGIIEGGFGGKTLSPEAIAQGIASYQVGQAEADTDFLPTSVEHITLKVFQHFQDALASVDNTRPATFATILITGLLTPEATPRPALGAVGAKGPEMASLHRAEKFFQTPQQDPQGHNLCIDHSAMKCPTPAFMKYVYVETLMHPRKESGEGFQVFGTWPNIGKSNETDKK